MSAHTLQNPAFQSLFVMPHIWNKITGVAEQHILFTDLPIHLQRNQTKPNKHELLIVKTDCTLHLLNAVLELTESLVGKRKQ